MIDRGIAINPIPPSSIVPMSKYIMLNTKLMPDKMGRNKSRYSIHLHEE
jgi:hypothetical protein